MAKRKPRKTGPVQVESTKHADKRVNIPTSELRDFVADAELEAKTMLYPRDPSLDPQLVWQGKDEQDSSDLEVPTVPIYIQEKVDPRVLVENLRETAKAGETEPELTLFDDFDDGLEFSELVDFYEHENNWSNRLILGDSLLVMNSLAEKESLKGQVQMIYIDPPYGIKFGSNWQVSTRKRTVKDGKDASRQPEQVKAFRDTWQLGIHSYLAYLRDRLVTARELLTETGSVFMQIGDENAHLARNVCDEVFGSENFVSQITVQKTTGAAGGQSAEKSIQNVNDYLLWYARDKTRMKYRPLFTQQVFGEEGARNYGWLELPDGTRRRMTAEEKRGPRAWPEGARAFADGDMTSDTGVEKTRFLVEFDDRTFTPGTKVWKTGEEGMERLKLANRLIAPAKSLRYVRYLNDFPMVDLNNNWTDMTGGVTGKVFVVQTNTKVVERCMLMTTDPGDLVLDPTCGSGTTAYVAEQFGRRWITIDTSRVALAIARARLMSAQLPYYLLADSEAGAKKGTEVGGEPLEAPFGRDVRRGFVYRRVPHIELRTISRSPEIVPGASALEIDEAIRHNADQEFLFDQPYEDRRTVRVTGRFTVESLSPHRTLESAANRSPGFDDEADTQFEDSIIDNLRKAGVHNTYAGEDIKFERLDILSGNVWIHAEGEFLDADGERRRVAISLGPEHGTVGPEQIKEAAKEALKGVGYDMLIVSGFAFDAHASGTTKEFEPSADGFASAEKERKFGKLRVLLAWMNPDLTMGDELLKKTGSGNLFMTFGEPDMDIDKTDDGLVLTIHGVDVYDPTTGQVRSSSTDDIAAWFIDTNYNQESFFVRHAYFTGAGEPFKQLARALKADINPVAWDQLYTTKSLPFPKPATGKIAIKVINHFGDEAMKVYDVG
jgi:adenine-specific DNA-methyltransferase